MEKICISKKSYLRHVLVLVTGIFVAVQNDCKSDVMYVNPIGPIGLGLTEPPDSYFYPNRSEELFTQATTLHRLNRLNRPRMMEGFAVFIPTAGGQPRWYIGHQRTQENAPGQHNLNNDPGAGGDLLATNDISHCERQLIHKAFQDTAGAGNMPAGGTFLIYTRRPPCCESTDKNGHFGCHQYYYELASACEVQFEIYFRVNEPSPGLDAHVLTTVSDGDISIVLNTIRNAFGNARNITNSFKTINGHLYMSSNEEIMDNTGALIRAPRTMTPRDQQIFINNLNRLILSGLDPFTHPRHLTDAQIEQIINTLYKINGQPLPENLHYHVTH